MQKAVITDHSFPTPDSLANTVAAAIRGEKLPNVVNGVSA